MQYFSIRKVNSKAFPHSTLVEAHQSLIPYGILCPSEGSLDVSC